MTSATWTFIRRKTRKLINEGYPIKQALAIAYDYARKAGYKVPQSNPYLPNALHRVFIGSPNQAPQSADDLNVAGIVKLLDKTKIPAIQNIFGISTKDAFAVVVLTESKHGPLQFVIMCEDQDDMRGFVDYLQDTYFP